jgi:AAA-like domain/Trypsin-like peptidase domain
MTAALESSLVRIYSNRGSVIGAGFLVSQKRILTCAHVVADALGIDRKTVEMPDQKVSLDFPILAAKQFLTARVIFWRPVNPDEFAEDIAGLELENSAPDAARPAQLVTSDELWGHRFRVLGFPAGQHNGVWASGELRAKLASGWVQLEDVKQGGYRLEPGFSGAPIWDEQLQGVAGMAVANETKRPETKAAFIIPANVLIKAWPELSEQAIPACPSISETPERNPEIYQPERLIRPKPVLRSKIYREIKQPRALICVKTSPEMDKASLIMQIMKKEIPQGYQAVSVDFQQANKDVFTKSDQLLKWLCTEITSQMQPENTLAESWRGVRFSNSKCIEYFETYLLSDIQTPLVLVLYNVELILEKQALANNFFGLLRSWHNKAANNNSWKELRLVIVHSKDIRTDPPFNV